MLPALDVLLEEAGSVGGKVILLLLTPHQRTGRSGSDEEARLPCSCAVKQIRVPSYDYGLYSSMLGSLGAPPGAQCSVIGILRLDKYWVPRSHGFHETRHSVTFIVLVNSHQR